MPDRRQPDLRPAHVDRFWSRVEVRGPDDCWRWRTQPNARVPEHRAANGKYGAAQISLYLAGKGWPRGTGALHSCDNSRCVNPAHLRWGTQTENVADKVERARCARGEASANSKLTARDVAVIRASSATQSELARRFGVTPAAIRQVVQGQTWAEGTPAHDLARLVMQYTIQPDEWEDLLPEMRELAARILGLSTGRSFMFAGEEGGSDGEGTTA